MRVALYARVSTSEQAIFGLSLEAQLNALREWAKSQTIVDEYVDDGVSARAALSKRPQLQRMLKDCEAGRIDLILFTKLDRFFRNIREYYKAQDILDAHNVAWRALQEDYETETAAGRLKVNIMLAVAQDEADRTSERVKAVFAEKRRKGLEVNGRMPPGLSYESGKMIPNDDAPKVKELFDYYAATRSLHATAYEARNIIGKQYSQRGMKQILMNGKYRESGIVPVETWNTVQAIITSRATRTVRTDRVYLFSGLLKCPVCGMKLTVRTRVYKGTEYIYYRCDRHDKGKRCAFNKAVKERELEAYLLRQIFPAIERYNVEIRKKEKRPVDIAKLQKKLDKLTDLYVDDSISKEEYDARTAPIRDAIRTAQSAPKPVDTAEIMRAVDVYPALSKAAQKAFWSVLVKSVTPSADGFSLEFF